MIIWLIICYMSFLAVMIYLERENKRMQLFKNGVMCKNGVIEYHQWYKNDIAIRIYNKQLGLYYE